MAVGLYSDLELELVLRQFVVPDGEYSFRPLTSGLINDTFLVSKSDKPLYVLQRINHSVFKNVSGLMSNMERALEHLNGENYTQLHLIRTQEGDSFYQTSKGPKANWRLMGYLEHTQTFDTVPNATVAFEAGRIIGAFHRLLEKSEPEAYEDTIPRFHDLSLRKEQFINALKTANPEHLTAAQTAISFAKETFAKLKALHIDELLVRVCHNDTKLNNILFSEKTEKALCLIDLDTLMAGHFLYDFGDAVRTIANTTPEDEQDFKKITFDKVLFTAFVNGLASNGDLLTKKEIDSLPLGVVLMPFLHGLRALTDYLENNRYYKVSYENQNLDRALSLFDFTDKAMHELDDITTIIKNSLETKP